MQTTLNIYSKTNDNKLRDKNLKNQNFINITYVIKNTDLKCLIIIFSWTLAQTNCLQVSKYFIHEMLVTLASSAVILWTANLPLTSKISLKFSPVFSMVITSVRCISQQVMKGPIFYMVENLHWGGQPMISTSSNIIVDSKTRTWSINSSFPSWLFPFSMHVLTQQINDASVSI